MSAAFRGGAALGVLGLILGGLPARAMAGKLLFRDWLVSRGSLEETAAPTAFILTTDASAFAFSYGLAYVGEPVQIPYEISLSWRRLSPDDRSIEVHVLGGVLLFAEGRLGLWVDDDRFAQRGWQKAPIRVHEQNQVVVTQGAEWVEVSLDGVPVTRFSLRAPARGRIGLALKGAPGVAARLRVENVRVRRLGIPRPSATDARTDGEAHTRGRAPRGR